MRGDYMKIANIRSIFLILWTFLGLIVPYSYVYAPPASPVGGAPQLSDEDLKFLEDLGKQIQDEVAKLPTREQLKAQGLSDIEIERGEKQGKIQTKEKFDEDVKRYSEMSEEQLFAEMEKALAEVERASTPEAQPEYPPAGIYQGEQEAPTPTPTPTPAAKPAVSSNKQQAAIQLIDTLLGHINKFLSKSQVMVGLPGKITSWIKEGKLKNWPASLTWNSFRAQVEELQAKLNKIKDKDTKSGAYKYLDDLIKDEGTYNNLVKLKNDLAKSEPKISLGDFGVDAMTSVSRQAVRDTLLNLQEALANMGVLAALDKLIEKYEPTAKKIKETEEAAQKKALEESRRGRSPSYTTVGGYPKYEGDYRGRYDFDRGATNYTPGKFETPEREKAREDSKKETKAGGGQAAGGKKADDKKPEGKKSAPEKPKREEDKTVTDLVKDFNAGIFDFYDAYEADQEMLSKIESHINDASFVEEKLYKELIPQATQGITKSIRAVNVLKRQLKNKTLTDEQKKEVKKNIRDALKEAKKDLENMSKQIENVSKSSAAATLVPGARPNPLFTQAKKYAYFGRKNAAEFRTAVQAQRATADTNRQEVEAARALGPLTQADAIKDEQTTKLEEQTQKLEDILKLERKDVADLSAFADKIKELQKVVNEL